MQYVRSISGSVSKTWNSINPATLSGAIDVIVVEQENGDLACSPFHVRFGKFSLLRPYEKKVEFRVNDEKTDYAMKLGEGGEAFFIFETSEHVPESLQTSPLVSPAASPRPSSIVDPAGLQEPDYLNIGDDDGKKDTASDSLAVGINRQAASPSPPPLSTSSSSPTESGSPTRGWRNELHMQHRSASEEALPTTASGTARRYTLSHGNTIIRPRSPDHAAAVERALELSRKLSIRDIPTQVTDRGDIMLDINGYKTGDKEIAEAEQLARKILAEELDGSSDFGGLIGADRDGNVWIYASEEAKEAAGREASLAAAMDSVSDGGYASDSGRSDDGTASGPRTTRTGDSTVSYAKTLRLTSAQLKSLNLQKGANKMTFTVNRATCTAYMYYWTYDVPIVISDIDGTITKSDALGHVLTMIGRDWTHLGVAKLYTDIAANGYHLMYLTSRSVGQADSTRNYLSGIVQDGYKLPRGPVIMSPDRTMAALRREVYLRKPEVFKMACLRDILQLFGEKHNPFYAGFGNRLTDALSYRSVNIPSTRIFTINYNAEVTMDLLTLTKYKSSYVNMRDLVDHFFPPVGSQLEQEYTDFNFWREPTVELFDSDEEDEDGEEDEGVEEEYEEGEGMRESFMTDASHWDDGEHYDEEAISDGEEEYYDEDEGSEYEDYHEAHHIDDHVDDDVAAATHAEPEPEEIEEKARRASVLPKTAMKIDLPGVGSMLKQAPSFLKEEGKAVVEKVVEAAGGQGGDGDGGEEDAEAEAEGTKNHGEEEEGRIAEPLRE